MTVHHTLTKKAQNNGVTLEQDDTETYRAFWPERNVEIFADSAKAALDTLLKIKVTMKEYPELRITQDDGDFVVMFDYENGEEGELATNEDLTQAIADALERYPDNTKYPADTDRAAGEEFSDEETEVEEGERHSIVRPKYRQEYAARGNPNHCGDWLAETMDDLVMVVGENGKPYKSLARTYAIAAVNGVTKTWPHLSNGQQAMNARNMMRPLVAKAGVLHVPGACNDGEALALKPDQDWIDFILKAKGRKPKVQ